MDYSTIKVMKTLRIVYLFVIAAIFAACSSTEDAVTDKPSGPTGSKTYTMTISANKHGDTRVLTLDGNTLNSSWATSDKIYVRYEGNSVGTLSPDANGSSAMLNGDIHEAIVNDFSCPFMESGILNLIYPSSTISYRDQVGTLEDIAAKYDYAEAEAIIRSVDDTSITADNGEGGPVTFQNQQAIVKFIFQNSSGTPLNVSSLNISVNNLHIPSVTSGEFNVNPASPTSELFVAIPGFSNKKVTLTATVGEDYTYSYVNSSVSFENGKYYVITVKMNLNTSNLNWPLTIKALADGVVSFTNKASGPVTYKIGGAKGVIIASGTTVDIPVETNNEIEFYGDNSTYATSEEDYSNISCTSDCVVYGNIMSLISSNNYKNLSVLSSESSSAFCKLFYGNTHIDIHPELKLYLPATTLANYCYTDLFYGCTGLTKAPELPATSLTRYCYFGMFHNCTSLTSAPELPATSLSGAEGCYGNMFYGCSSLSAAPELPATSLDVRCYAHMFRGCTSLSTAPELPATTLFNSCYDYMFYGCTGLTSTPDLPATSLADGCYADMFGRCSNLISCPTRLPATELKDMCYAYMFQFCTSLTTAPELPATSLANGCYTYMFNECSSLSAAPELPATSLEYRCYANMFYGCSSLSAAPELPATSLAEECYSYMFSRCRNLQTPPVLPATSLAKGCYQGMFSDCTNLTTAPALPVTELAIDCYRSMFYNCDGLTSAPDLPATTLVSGCYRNMFEYCNNISRVKCLATNPTSSYSQYWLMGVSSSGTFIKAKGVGSWSKCIDGIPSNWTVEDAE